MRLASRLKSILTVHLPILIKTEMMRRFPSLWGRIGLEPSSAWLNVTDNCNMRCIMCKEWRETKSGELTTEEWKDAIRQTRALGIGKIGFSGGEPLLRKDIAELTAFASGLGMDCALISNGYLLDQKRLDSLIDAGLGHISLSLDGTGEQYEAIRGREWSRAERAARLVAAAYRSGRIDANIGFVLMRQSLGHLDRLRAFRKELGLPLIVNLVDCTPFFFRIAENERGGANSSWILREDRSRLRSFQQTLIEMKREDHHSVLNTYADIEYMAAYFEDPKQARIPCPVSQLRILVNSRGEVFGGCWSMSPYGSLRERPLGDILSSKGYRRAHKAMFYKLCPGCSCGYTTNVRYSMGLQLRDRMFNLVPPLRSRIAGSDAPVPEDVREEA